MPMPRAAASIVSRVVLCELLWFAANFVLCHGLWKGAETCYARLKRAAPAERIWLICDAAARNTLTVHPVPLIVVNLCHRRVDGDLMKVRSSEARNLRVDVGVDAPR